MVLTDLQKMEIVVKSNNGLSIRNIADSMCINRNTVQKWIYRYKTQNNLNRKRGSGLHQKYKKY